MKKLKYLLVSIVMAGCGGDVFDFPALPFDDAGTSFPNTQCDDVLNCPDASVDVDADTIIDADLTVDASLVDANIVVDADTSVDASVVDADVSVDASLETDAGTCGHDAMTEECEIDDDCHHEFDGPGLGLGHCYHNGTGKGHCHHD